MQCPKCGYEPTMAEQLAGYQDCPRCSASGGDENADRRSWLSLKTRTGAAWAILIGATVAVIVIGSIFWYGHIQARNLLLSEAEQKVRLINGMVTELLDQDAALTRLGFAEKAARRVIELDSMVAQSLSMNDAKLPGLGVLVAEYGKAARSLIVALNRHSFKEAEFNVALSAFNAQEKNEKIAGFKDLMDIPSEQLSALADAALKAIEQEEDLRKKIRLLSDAGAIEAVMKWRGDYYGAKAELAAKQSARDKSAAILDQALRRLANAGAAINAATGRRFPVTKYAPD